MKTESAATGELAIRHDVALRPGERLGRYVVEERLGAGAMGEVYGARDPELDRSVAIKIAHARTLSRGGGGERFLREARAMAAVHHPNVVALYDFGLRDGMPYLVMERIDALTMTEWLGKNPRRKERLRLLLAAGRGLAAAHDAGLIHRDFKPANVLVARGLRAKVADFGLARAPAAAARQTRAVSQLGEVDLSIAVTRPGDVVGTPLYMAPEQHLAQPGTTRSDQFSFAVSACEVLTGRRPFTATSMAGLLAQKMTGTADIDERQLPAHVVAAIRRGLSPDPADRYASIEAMLADLRPRARARRWWPAAVPLAVGGVMALSTGKSPQAPCRASAGAIESAWGPHSQRALAERFAGSSQPHAAASHARVVAVLDEVADGWVAAHVLACTLEPQMRDASMACLGRERERLATTVNALGRDDSIDGAVATVATLGEPSTCLHSPAQRRQAARSRPGVEKAVAEARAHRLAAVASIRAGDADTALRELNSAVRIVRRLDPHLQAALLMQLGGLLDDAGAFEEATTVLRESLSLAETNVDPRTAAGAAIHLVFAEGVSLERYADGVRRAHEAEALLARFDAPLEMHVSRLTNLSAVHDAFGDAGEAMRALLQARAVLEAGPPAKGAAAATLRLRALCRVEFDVGVVAVHRGDDDTAVDAFERSLVAAERVFGPDHPELVGILTAQSVAEMHSGDLDSASAAASRAWTLLSRTRGPEHPTVAVAQATVAAIDAERDELDIAAGRLKTALEVLSHSPATLDDAWLATAIGLADVRRRQGDTDQAQRWADAAWVRVRSANDPALLPHRVDALFQLGLIASARGEHDRALELAAQAVAAKQDTALERSPDDLPLTVARLSILAAAGRTGQAEAAALDVVDRADRIPNAVAAQRAKLQAADVLLRGDAEAAVHAHELVVEVAAWSRRNPGAAPYVAAALARARAKPAASVKPR